MCVCIKVRVTLLWEEPRLIEPAVDDSTGMEYFGFRESVFGEEDPTEIDSWKKLGLWYPILSLGDVVVRILMHYHWTSARLTSVQIITARGPH